ncbi:DUF6000 family protein [Streptomyces sp. NPDC096095]|uniref:DUF6000 family protein n=1 Tax=Streptomyces sp. NPDC096095 TaxID=3155545 RepID=UPI0033281E13
MRLLRRHLLLDPARLGTHADAEILTTSLDRCLPRTGLHQDQPAVLGALLRLGTPTPAASPSPTAHETSGSTPWPTPATTATTPLPSNTAGRASTVTSPMAGPARDPVIPDRVATLVVDPVTPMNGQGTTEHERGNGQHRRTSIPQARLMPNSLSDANRNDAVTVGVDRRVPCRPVVVGRRLPVRAYGSRHQYSRGG